MSFMDDEFALGTAVWGTADPDASQLDDFDDFDDFGTAPTEPSEVPDDDFGDFGDFGDAQGFSTPEENDDVPVAGPSNWQPLTLDPMPSRLELEEDINEILVPIWLRDNIADFTTDDPIRETHGVNQILISSERYKLQHFPFLR
jgi:hypothetical protein